MRFDFSRFVLDIERRSRRFRGLFLSFKLLFYGSLASIAAITGIQWLIPNLDRKMLLLVLLIPLLMALIAFLVGWWRRPSLPRLLLKLDDELETGARISSLYEERLRGHDSFFRYRLESLVETISADWKRGLRLPHRALGFLSAGLSGILIAVIILLFPLPFPQAVSMETSTESESSEAQLPRSTAQETARGTRNDAAAATIESREPLADSSPPDPSQETKPLRPNEELSLDSVFDELSNQSRGQAQVDMPTTTDELMDLANAQEEARQALSDMPQELQNQMQGAPRPLTQQESKQLQDLASQTGDSELEERTDDIVGEPNPDQVEEKLQDLMDEMNPDADDPESSPDTDEDTSDGAGQDSPQSTEVTGDEEAGQKFLERAAERMEEQANVEAGQEDESQQTAEPQNEDDSEDPSQDGQAEMRIAGDDDLSQEGGDEGLEGPDSDGPEPGTVGFVREEANAAVGEEGGFIDEFVTKGVPVEIDRSQRNNTTRYVDFERLDSILQNRDLPEEAQASIRRYFELITQPEGGS